MNRMNRTTDRRLLALAACGLVGGITGITASASAQSVVNIAGSSLFENFFSSQASTNDFIDVNNDGISLRAGTGRQQLAPFNIPPAPGSQWWAVQYLSAGSGNGLAYMVNYGINPAVGADGVEIRSIDIDNAYYNRAKWKDLATGLQSIADTGNPGAAVVRSDSSFTAAWAPGNTPADGGLYADLAVMDVPTRWFVTLTGTPNYGRLPNTPGYGLNARRSVNNTGGATGANQSNQLKSLGTLNLFDPANPGGANDHTVFDTAVAHVPIAIMTNLGTGLTRTTASDIRYLNVTGRLSTGENLVCITRDSGSGTRNAAMNAVRLDPSWGIGENVGPKNDSPTNNVLGPNFWPSNKGGSGSLENSVANHRLAVGYSGAERGVGTGTGWLATGKAELLAVRNDGSSVYNRPTIGSVLHNSIDGYTIAGPETFASIGDPLAAPVSKGGDANGRPAIRNVEAAAYLNNITRSIAAFDHDPGSDSTVFSPGELLATQFILSAAVDNAQDPADPTHLIANATFNATLQDFVLAHNVLGNSAYASFGAVTLNGKVPARTTPGVAYSDGVANGANYITQGGASVSYGSNLSSRNRIAGDFSGDGLRNLNDAADMIAAWRQRNGGPTWTAPDGTGPIAGAPGSDAIIEVLGDFNGDGNFDAADIRYWADGLAIDPATGNLDRKQGFIAVDASFGGNFFGTTLSTNHTYTPGASRADVAGRGHTTGHAPVGGDGIIDGADLDYIYAQFCGNPFVTDNQANWSSLAEAAGVDLSCDLNGDLVVDQADVTEFYSILGTCRVDTNLDGQINVADFLAFLALYASGSCRADFNADGQVNVADFLTFLSAYAAGC
jgi:hypothetical protein